MSQAYQSYGVKHGMQGEESPGKHQQGSKDGFMNGDDDGVVRKALGQNGASTPSSGWIWNEASQQYYTYDRRSDTLLYQSGQRVPRPSNIPASTLIAAMSQYQPGSRSQYGRQAISGAETSAYYQQPAPTPVDQASMDLSVRSLRGMGIRDEPATGSIPVDQQTAGRTRQDSVQGLEQYEDATSHVKLMLKTGPANEITDPALRKRGIQATALIYSPNNTDREVLFRTFRKQDKEYFTVGKAFTILWVNPPAVSQVQEQVRSDAPGKLGEKATCKIRRMVVIGEGESYCTALPIENYGPHGVGKAGVVKSNHTIVHVGQKAPMPTEVEKPVHYERPMQLLPIRIVPDESKKDLHPLLRLNFGIVYTIQHNVKVQPLGRVHADSMSALMAQFANVWPPTESPPARSRGQSATGESVSRPWRADEAEKQSPMIRSHRPNGSVVAGRSEAVTSGNESSNGRRVAPSTAAGEVLAPNYSTMSSSNPISHEEMIHQMTRLAEYAASNKLTLPAPLTAPQIRTFAQHPVKRKEYLSRIHHQMKTQLANRTANDDEDDSTDDDSSEDSDG